MKRLTAVFLHVLGTETNMQEQAAELVRNGLRAEFEKRAGRLLSSGTLYFSEEAHRLQQNLMMLRQRVETFRDAGDAVLFSDELEKMYIEAERLHRITQKQIRRAGRIDVRRLHFFYQDEQAEALDILDEYIRIELYRILVLCGGDAFRKCKPLRGYKYTLADRIQYLKSEILPVTDSGKLKSYAEGLYWAVQHRDAMRTGPMGILPGYEMVPPAKVDHRFLIGEHRSVSVRSGLVYQGVGCLTNVTPKNVEKAQLKGFLSAELLPEQMYPYADQLQDPDQILPEIFRDTFYVIEAAHYFSIASYVEASKAVGRRKRLGQCLFCGKNAEGACFCEQCRRRIKIV